ncbi:hypothetical protein IJH72_03015 [Candidatus Saccharibacteria bacterium]|nr:hypothetical protein [Candidatus Saccharibacteria bacterium]
MNSLIQSIISSTKTFGLTLQEGAEAARGTSTPTTSSATTTSGSQSYLIQSVGLVLSIIVAVAFNQSVKRKIQNKEDFSGMGWGLANGIIGVGFLWVIIAHSSINKEIEKIKDKKYKKYAELQMKDFIRTYGFCLVIWIVILLVFTFS